VVAAAESEAYHVSCKLPTVGKSDFFLQLQSSTNIRKCLSSVLCWKILHCMFWLTSELQLVVQLSFCAAGRQNTIMVKYQWVL